MVSTQQTLAQHFPEQTSSAAGMITCSRGVRTALQVLAAVQVNVQVNIQGATQECMCLTLQKRHVCMNLKSKVVPKLHKKARVCLAEHINQLGKTRLSLLITASVQKYSYFPKLELTQSVQSMILPTWGILPGILEGRPREGLF